MTTRDSALARAHDALALAATELEKSAKAITDAERSEAAKRERLAAAAAELAGAEDPAAFNAATDAHRWAAHDHGLAVQRLAEARRDHEPLVAAHAAAIAAVRAITGSLRRAHGDAIAAKLAAIRAEEIALVAQLEHQRCDPAGLSPTALAALESPPARPTTSTLRAGPGIVSDIHSPICGRPEILGRAAAYWRDFEATLERDDSARERAA